MLWCIGTWNPLSIANEEHIRLYQSIIIIIIIIHSTSQSDHPPKPLSVQEIQSRPFQAQKHVFELHTPILASELCQKQPYLKSTYSSSALFESVECLHVIESTSSNMAAWVPLDANTYIAFQWTTPNMSIILEFILEIRQCKWWGLKPMNIWSVISKLCEACVYRAYGCILRFGVHSVYVNSSIVDDGALVKTSPLQNWRPMHSNSSPLN